MLRTFANLSLEAFDVELVLLDARVRQPCQLLCVLELRAVRERTRLHQVRGTALDRLPQLLEEWSEAIVQFLHHGLLVEVAGAHLQTIVLSSQLVDSGTNA